MGLYIVTKTENSKVVQSWTVEANSSAVAILKVNPDEMLVVRRGGESRTNCGGDGPTYTAVQVR